MSDSTPSAPNRTDCASYTEPKLSGTQELTTPRLDLRRFKERDAQAAYEWSQDELVMAYFQGYRYSSAEEAKCAIGSWRIQYGNDDFLLWCIQEAESRTAVGKISASVDIACSAAEIEYSMGPASRGKGYAPEALSAVIDYLHHIGVHRVFARIATDNYSSARVAEKAGMVLEGICTDALVDRNGKFYDVAIFAHVDGNGD